ncbi:hypothetical protein BGZ83_003276 [Gryganskiella cystojenkinii]|nr:hypothetical protein BGZ83_003276 [Gryganskiella cystojenkinii]
MRLRATIHRNLLFFKLAQSVEKIGKSCFIKFTPEYVCFGAIHSIGDNDPVNGGGAIQCWSRVDQGQLFLDYKVESNSDNEIYLEMKVEDLLLALRSSNNATAVTMRMTGKSADAYLSFSITADDHMHNSRVITQEVPIVKIMSRDGAKNTTAFDEPMVPPPDVHIMLPPLDRLRHITSSYRTIADYVVVSVNLSGEILLSTSDGVQQFSHYQQGAQLNHPIDARYGIATKAQIETRFSGLVNPSLTLEQQHEDDDDPESGESPYSKRARERPREYVSAMVRIVDLQKVLQSHYVKPQSVICSK